MSIDLNIKLQDEEANANKYDHDMENDDTSKSTTDDYQDMPELFTPAPPNVHPLLYPIQTPIPTIPCLAVKMRMIQTKSSARCQKRR